MIAGFPTAARQTVVPGRICSQRKLRRTMACDHLVLSNIGAHVARIPAYIEENFAVVD